MPYRSARPPERSWPFSVCWPKADYIKNSLDVISQSKGKTYLVDSKGNIIYHPDLPYDKEVNIATAPAVKKVLQGLEGYEKGPDPLTGKTVISGYKRVDSSGWGVITERSIEEVLAPVKDVARGIYIFTAIMLLLGGSLAYRRSALINKLSATANELQQSNEAQQEMNEELEAINEELQSQQEELAESNQQLAEASQTKSDFLANMSHELRTPLNSVIGFSEVLQDQLYGKLNEKQQKYVKNIQTNGKHLLSLINDILDLSKVESGRMELDLCTFPAVGITERVADDAAGKGDEMRDRDPAALCPRSRYQHSS